VPEASNSVPAADSDAAFLVFYWPGSPSWLTEKETISHEAEDDKEEYCSPSKNPSPP
jgi:hypothetical protein